MPTATRSYPKTFSNRHPWQAAGCIHIAVQQVLAQLSTTSPSQPFHPMCWLWGNAMKALGSKKASTTLVLSSIRAQQPWHKSEGRRGEVCSPSCLPAALLLRGVVVFTDTAWEHEAITNRFWRRQGRRIFQRVQLTGPSVPQQHNKAH